MRKKRFQYLLLLVLFSFIILGSFYVENYQNHFAPLNIHSVKKTTGQETSNTESKEVPQQSGEKLSSGRVNVLPWENDSEFIKAKEENDTPILMSAYRTVLRDPLPGEEYNVHLAAKMLAGIIVKPGQIFSQNQSIGPYTESKGFKKGPTYIGSNLSTTIGGGVCKIASTLYNVTILSNLQVIERHAHSMPVPYVPYGQDATVSYGAKDFKFKNDASHPIMIWAQGIDNILYIGFYGRTSPPEIEWHHEILQVKKAPNIYKINPELEPGTEKLVLEGMDGVNVISWISIINSDNSVTIKEMGKSNYNPMASIYERNR